MILVDDICGICGGGFIYGFLIKVVEDIQDGMEMEIYFFKTVAVAASSSSKSSKSNTEAEAVAVAEKPKFYS